MRMILIPIDLLGAIIKTVQARAKDGARVLPGLAVREAPVEHTLNLQWRIGAQSASGSLADCVTNAIDRLKRLLD